ncbi:MAG: NAD(P)-dependent oxidoreductase [Parvibaculum sp.]
MRVLVTGTSGFVGRHVLAPLVATGAEVFAVSRNHLTAEGVCHIKGDLLVEGSVRPLIEAAKPDLILHLAWCVEHGRFWTNPANLDWVKATLSLAQTASNCGVKRIVAVGTCYEYDWPEVGDCVEDETPLAAHTLYDVSKDATRRLLQSFCHQHGIEFAWARLFFLYGPDEVPARLVSSLALSLLAGRPAAMSSGKAIRDFMDVRDAAAALAQLGLSGVQGAVNIASGQAHTIREIAERLAVLSGRPDLLQVGALADREGEPLRISACVKRLRDEVGFAGGRSLDQGLAEALDSWRG